MSKHSQRPVFDDRPKGLPPKHRPKHNTRGTPMGNLVGRNINPRDLMDNDDDGSNDDDNDLEAYNPSDYPANGFSSDAQAREALAEEQYMKAFDDSWFPYPEWEPDEPFGPI